MITKIQGDEGDRGSISTYTVSPSELTDSLNRIESIIQEHYKNRFKKKPKTMDAVMRMANIRHDIESDDDEDYLEDHEIVPGVEKKNNEKGKEKLDNIRI